MGIFVEIDCAKANWKGHLKENLQDNLEVNLRNFNYQRDGQFCELLGMAHLIPFRIDYRRKRAFFSARGGRQSPNSNPESPPPPPIPPSIRGND